MKFFLTCFLFSILTATTINAQKRPLKNRFNVGITAGVNASQLDGDHFLGFDKIGFFGGVRAIARINTNDEFVMEMQYNRKGSRNPEQFVPGKTSSHRFISLDYIEVPILYHKKIEAEKWIYSVEGGIAYARLFGFKINEIVNSTTYKTFTPLQDDFNKNELALIMGGGVFINENIRVMGRFSVSLTLLYKNENPRRDFPGEAPSINDLRNYQLAFGANYIF